MTPEQTIVACAVREWTMNTERARALFTGLDTARLSAEVAPGRNRLVYLWGHLIAVHDAMLPLLGFGPRRHPELDEAFLNSGDRAVEHLPSAEELTRLWDEVDGALQAGFRSLSAAEWVQKHTAVSDEGFVVNPLRNRLAVLLNRTSHMAYHLGQARLAL
jgi:DinB superfamily